MDLKGRHFVDLQDFKDDEILFLIEYASRLKELTREGENQRNMLKGKSLVLIFAKPSLRTRVSFEVGAMQLGMGTLTLKQDEINLGVRETIADTARVLSRYADCTMIRTFAHKDVVEFAKYSKTPVINGLTDSSHPCQIMADLLTTKEHFGKLKGLKLAYVGDGNNVANTLLVGCAKVGMDVVIGCPEGYEPDEKYLEYARSAAKANGSTVEIVHSPERAVNGANVLYTDVWASMGQESEARARKKIFRDYQINKTLLDYADPKAIVLHCLPAHRGEEITNDVLEKYSDIIFEQAENRMHAQKAILAAIVG
ncbi:ornithine carbamoyltransferase [Candidatus Gastranaerophilus sp. (ex Termes propinquus)]|nr:ornithine carbamoyltransferase [Candidatus Gastranaerophilus sp. (ex Termes propinquus)]